MLKKTITYIDFDGNQRKEDLYFNMTRSELIEFSFGLPDLKENVSDKITKQEAEELGKKMVEKMGGEGMYKFVKDLIFKSFGVKSEDGRRFIKNEQLSIEFTQTMAYDELLMDIFSTNEKANEFLNGVIPPEMANRVSVNALPGAN